MHYCAHTQSLQCEKYMACEAMDYLNNSFYKVLTQSLIQSLILCRHQQPVCIHIQRLINTQSLRLAKRQHHKNQRQNIIYVTLHNFNKLKVAS